MGVSTNIYDDPLVAKLSYDLNESQDMIRKLQKQILELEEKNGILTARTEQLMKDNIENWDRYLSIVGKIKEIGM